jgi:hypothetical protein
MHRHQYLQQPEIASFSAWFAEILSGKPIAFSVKAHANYDTLHSALLDYKWPNKRVDGLAADDTGYQYPSVNTLAANSSLADNTKVIETIQSELKAAYNQGEQSANALAGAVAAVLHWGGVYTTISRNGKKHGNKAWLATNRHQLHAILKAVITDYALGEDRSGIQDLRFNAGMTKVYALLIDHFIIYDSRVAAALAWLALKWWTSQEKPESDLPGLIRFGCMDGRGKLKGCRNPHPKLFPLIASKPEEHYMWNVRSNWLLLNALQTAGPESKFTHLREVEAALFQIGYKIK